MALSSSFEAGFVVGGLNDEEDEGLDGMVWVREHLRVYRLPICVTRRHSMASEQWKEPRCSG